ncbi:putative alpha beta hydrolase [Diaporthe ampelina]|uniref:Putative alpha beta hydrolase n=1 Tax=Diaporthe ampelina TaxID=1214573 RepID=A0A0G2HZ96_9PEZI|nr:putative alpha beta hydrolase [Diaporthe ampelina]
MAAELLDVLASAEVEPPYVLVAHSYGGIVAREVLAAAGPDAVVGMILVDANQENTHKTLREPLLPLAALAGPERLALLDMTGLLAGRDHYMPEELSLLTLDAERESKEKIMSKEMASVPNSSEELAQKKQFEAMALMMGPITVIRGDTKRDYRRVISATQQAGVYGEARKELAKLSEFVDSRFDVLDCSGHAVIATEPKLVADEVSSIWEGCILGGF